MNQIPLQNMQSNPPEPEFKEAVSDNGDELPVQQIQEEQAEKKPLFSNKVQRIVLLVIDIMGLAGFLTYCYFIQSYFSTFYLLMLLLLIQFTWQTYIERVGMFEKMDSNQKKYFPLIYFVANYNSIAEQFRSRKTIYQPEKKVSVVESVYSDDGQPEILIYKPMFWVIFKDIKKNIWITIVIVSGLALIMKSVFVGLLNTKPNETADLMSIDNYEGLEIYFQYSDDVVQFQTMDYIKIFVPNGGLFLFSCFVMLLRRVNNKRYLEEFQVQIQKQVFNFYVLLVWLFLATIISTTQSMLGYVFFVFQIAFTLRLFCANKFPSAYDLFLLSALKYYLYFILTMLFLVSTPYFVSIELQHQEVSQFLGFQIISNLVDDNYWKSYVFITCSLLLFALLCIIREQIVYEQRRILLELPIKDCADNYEQYAEKKQYYQKLLDEDILHRTNFSIYENDNNQPGVEPGIEPEQLPEDMNQDVQEERKSVELVGQKQPSIRMSHVEDNEATEAARIFSSINNHLYKFSDKFMKIIDQPIVTLRILQILCIVIAVLQKTYESLMLVIWILITGFTLSRRINSITSIMLAIPSILTNLLTFYYYNIPGIAEEDSRFSLCWYPSTDTTNTCRKFGFFVTKYQFINILLMDVTFCGFLLFLKQVQEEQMAMIAKSRKKQEGGLNFMKNKKSTKNQKVGWWTIIAAIILRASYIVSLLIVFYVGFFDVNLIQFTLVLFLLIFLINNSTMSSYSIADRTKPGQMKEIIVPFAFKYWVSFVILISLIIIVRYIYLLFYKTSNNTDWILSLIGIDSRKQYEIVFWVLFYFVSLQYDSYKTKTYLKYSNKIMELILIQTDSKNKFGETTRLMGRLSLIYMKAAVWVSFSLNICFILFSPYSYLNTALLVIVGSIFVYYSVTFTHNPNYNVMTTLWYIYLNILILSFIIRYIFQFMCLPDYNQIMNSQFKGLYDQLQFNYSSYGFYVYSTSQLRIEYFPDMLTIFFGALSLNSYRFFAQTQKEAEEDERQFLEQNESALSIDSSKDGSQSGENEDKLLDRIQKEEIRQFNAMMKISILDEWAWIRTPVLIFAQVSTDIMTLFVVFYTVFYLRSIAALILLILYLSYFFTVHNELLNIMGRSKILTKLNEKIKDLSLKYVNFNDQQVSLENNIQEEKEIRRLANDIALTRMRIRILKKTSIWKYSFGFTALCVLLTYISQFISITSVDNLAIKSTSISLFLFGTYAQETYPDGKSQSCFCGSKDLNQECPTDTSKPINDILSVVLFYLILLFANVVDAGCTMILNEELKKDMLNLQKEDQEFREELVIKRKTPNVKVFNSDLGVIREVEDEEDQASIHKSEIDVRKLELKHFQERFPFFTYTVEETYDEPIELSEQDKIGIRKQSLLIMYYNSKSKILQMKVATAAFVILQRTLILILLFNTIIVNNIFSLVYLGVATMLFLSSTGIFNVKILNTFSVFAIWLQYTLLLLNYQPDADKIPNKVDRTSNDFSVVFNHFADDQWWLSYLGFANGDIMNCSYLHYTPKSSTYPLFSSQYCEANSLLNWVFIINTMVLSLIYVYFLVVQQLANLVLRNAIRMEYDVTYTYDILTMLMQSSKIKIKLNYQNWKARGFTFLSATCQQIIRNSHIIIISLIILLAVSNRIVFNYVELFAGISYFSITEFYYKWPRSKEQNEFESKYFKWMFFIPVFTIASFTILKVPWLLNECASQRKMMQSGEYYTTTSDVFIFFCVEVFDIHISGMVWIMFLISLHFDLLSSQERRDFLTQLHQQDSQKARMVSNALAYNENHKKYKAVLRVQEQKAIFKLIQSKAQEKLQVWHQKLLDKNADSELIQQEINQQVVQDSQSDEKLRKSFYEEISVAESPDQQIRQEELSGIQKFCISAIKTLLDLNDQYKFMGPANLMDYILAQNLILQRHIDITIWEHLKGDYSKFDSELEFLGTFYRLLYKSIAKSKSIKIDIEPLIEETTAIIKAKQKVPLMRSTKKLTTIAALVRSQVKSQLNKVTEFSIPKSIKSKKPKPLITYDQFMNSTELSFIHIDCQCGIEIFNTKASSALPSLSTFKLILKTLQECLRLMMANWKSICYLLIIFYYAKNSALMGAFLPLVLFTWVLIDEKATTRMFWILAYATISIITLMIFGYSLRGLEYSLSDDQQTITSESKPWYYPLYDSTYGLIYEVFLIWVIILQVYESKKYGLYYQSLQDIENIFQGYVRMKINKFNKFVRKQIIEETRKINDEPQTQKLLTDSLKELDRSNMDDDDIYQQPTKQLKKQVSDVVESEEKQFQQPPLQLSEEFQDQSPIQQPPILSQELQDEQDALIEQLQNPLIFKASNNIEKRLLMDPGLLQGQFSFVDRIFSFKFSRPGMDLYTATAIIQIIIILYTIIFFTNMINDGTNINNILKTNQIPGSLIWALLIEIIFMVVERFITLRDSVQIFDEEDNNKEEDKEEDKKKKKQSLFRVYKQQFIMKFALQLVTISVIYWFVFIHLGKPWDSAPDTLTSNETNTNYMNFRTNGYVICFLLLFCVYFTISALQLRYGYRQLKLRNTFMRSYGTIPNIFAKTFYAIPFLFELKVLMDWTFLETSLDAFQWFKLEDIHGLMYFTKNQSKGYIQRPLGMKIPTVMKCGMGCTFVLFILMCILGPLILFSTLNPSSQLNLVTGGDFQLGITNVKTSLSVILYSTNQLYGLENQLYTQSDINTKLNQTCKNQIINQAPQQGGLQEFQLLSYSNTDWDISYPLYNQLVEQLQDVDSKFIFNVSFTFTREQEKVIPTKNQFSYPGNEYLSSYPGQNQTYLDADQISTLYKSIVECSEVGYPLQLPSFYVQTMQLYSADGTTFKPRPINGDGVNSVENAILNFQCGKDVKSPTYGPSWWTLTYNGNSQNIVNNEQSAGLLFFIVSDRYSPLTYGFSIITIYSSVILLIGSFIRGLFSGQVWLLEYNGMVYPDDLIMICEAISIARSQKDLKKENLLYFELIDILRSPEIVKVMTGSWSSVFKKQGEQQQLQQQQKQKQD